MNNDARLDLGDVKDKWGSIYNVPEDLAPHGFPGLTKQSITNALGGPCEYSQILAMAASDLKADAWVG